MTVVEEFVAQYGWFLVFGAVMFYLLILHLNKRRSSQHSPAPPASQGQHNSLYIRTPTTGLQREELHQHKVQLLVNKLMLQQDSESLFLMGGGRSVAINS